MATISCDRVTKIFDNGAVAVREVSLTITDGEFMVLVGPSGSGKSTALRMIAGLEEITGGTSASASRSSTTSAPATATSQWCSRATRSTRT